MIYLYNKPIFYWGDLLKTGLKRVIYIAKVCVTCYDLLLMAFFHLEKFKLLMYFNLFIVFSIVFALF